MTLAGSDRISLFGGTIVVIMRTKIPLVWLALSITLSPKTAHACVCSTQDLNERDDAAREFTDAAVVFEGEVLQNSREIAAPSGEKAGISMTVFRVMRSYKGKLGDSIEVYDAWPATDCAVGPFRSGGKFFVYGFQGSDGKIYLSYCSRTISLNSAGPDLRYARGEPATKADLVPAGERRRLERDPSLSTTGATLRGIVHRADAGDVSKAFLTAWKVDKEGHRLDLVAATQKVNADGSFAVRYLTPGQYFVTAEVSRVNLTSRFVGEFGNARLLQAQTLSGVDLLLRSEPLGRVSVRVIAPQGLHDRMFVRLADVEIDSMRGAPYKYAQSAYLDDKNVASFEYVPYSLYNVQVIVTGPDASKWQHDQTQVHLNGGRAETIVELREAQKE